MLWRGVSHTASELCRTFDMWQSAVHLDHSFASSWNQRANLVETREGLRARQPGSRAIHWRSSCSLGSWAPNLRVKRLKLSLRATSPKLLWPKGRCWKAVAVASKMFFSINCDHLCSESPTQNMVIQLIRPDSGKDRFRQTNHGDCT